MTLQQFITKWNGKTLGYPEGSYVGECLSLVKQYMNAQLRQDLVDCEASLLIANNDATAFIGFTAEIVT